MDQRLQTLPLSWHQETHDKRKKVSLLCAKSCKKLFKNGLKPGLVNFQNNQKLVCELKSKIPEVSSLVPDPKACGTISELGLSLLWSFVAPGEDYDDETDVIDDGVKGDNDDNGDETDAIGAVYNESNGVVHHI